MVVNDKDISLVQSMSLEDGEAADSVHICCISNNFGIVTHNILLYMYSVFVYQETTLIPARAVITAATKPTRVQSIILGQGEVANPSPYS